MLRKKVYVRRDFFYVRRDIFYVAPRFTSQPPRRKWMPWKKVPAAACLHDQLLGFELRFGLCLAALLGRLLHKPVLLLLSSFRGGAARLLLRGAGVVSPLMRQGKNGVACVDKYMQPVVTGWGAEGCG